jgi:four helix bundle protein
VHEFKKLIVWQEAMELTILIYQITKAFPSDERFGLISQMNRCVVSIPSNIAEGAGRNNKNEFNQFLGIARGSSHELETQLIISNKLNLLSEDTLNIILNKINVIQKMIHKLQNSLQKNKLE